MKLKKKALFFVMSALIASPVLAEGPGWTGRRDVVEVVTIVNGGINVKLDPELTACQSLSGYGPKYASIYPEHPGLNLMQTNLVAAMMTNKKVSLYLGDDTCKVTEMRFYKN